MTGQPVLVTWATGDTGGYAIDVLAKLDVPARAMVRAMVRGMTSGVGRPVGRPGFDTAASRM
jgi:hypothetical protein